MPVIPGYQVITQTVQDVAKQLKSNPEFYNLLGGAAGYSTEPMLTVSNEILSRILAENMPWKWNREIWPPFLTTSLQQDYISNVTDIGWLEDGWIVDINNSTSNANQAPKPIRPLETVRDIPAASVQSVPFQVCFIPNTDAVFGIWQPNAAYGCGYGVARVPTTPIQQFVDANGNFLFIDSSQLGLNIESPGYTGTTLTPPGFFPYGVSGSTQPEAPVNATPGTMVQDGTVTWTVADQNGFALRFLPLPALNGLCWYVVCRYQMAPPNLPTMQTSFSPLPMQMMYLLRAGIRAALTRENNLAKGQEMYAEWEEQLMRALRAADRQQEENVLMCQQTILGNSYQSWQTLGAANPYGSALWNPGYGN